MQIPEFWNNFNLAVGVIAKKKDTKIRSTIIKKDDNTNSF